jgi:glutathione peroxidase
MSVKASRPFSGGRLYFIVSLSFKPTKPRCGANPGVLMLFFSSFLTRAAWTNIGAAALLAFSLASPAQAQSAASPGAACPAVLQHNFLRLQDEKPQDLCQYAGKVVLVVNTASFCGFTPQYEGLEALSTRYKDRGLVVLGFPSNDFSQEKGSNQDIASFCENTFNVKFTMFVKSRVSGSGANPLFKQLSSLSGTTTRWNFYKYLVSRDGSKVSGFNSMVEPQDPRFIKALETLLAAK